MFASKYLIAIAAIVGFITGSAVGGFGMKSFYDYLIIPTINEAALKAKTEAVNNATTRCEEQITSATTVAAEKAKVAERNRLQAINDAALKTYQAALQKSEQELTEARKEQEQKDKEHELQLAEAGRSCPLNRTDIDYLNGVRDKTSGN